MNIEYILEYYKNNIHKERYQVAKELKINKNTFCSIIDKHFANNKPLNDNLEKIILEIIKLYPYTGTKRKISNIINTSQHSINQLLLKTNNPIIKEHFNKPLYSAKNITDNDIDAILEGSKNGIGNDLMGIKIGIDGATVRYIRKKFLSSEDYNKYHSPDKFAMPWNKGYQNDRGDILLSSLEEKVCDFLYKNSIKYQANISLSHKNKTYFPDILLIDNNVFIEIFGMSNVYSYQNRMYEKIKFYNENKIKCLFLFQESFYENLDWQEKIIKFIKEIKNKKYNKNIKINQYDKISINKII